MLINRARTFYERTAGLRDNGIAGYGFALAIVALAMLARFLLAGQQGGFPYLTFIPAILLASFICGWRAGALAAFVGGVVHWYFQAPESAAGAVGFTPPNILGFSMYAFAVIVILTLIGVMHLAFRDFTQSEKQRKALNAELETRVRERTEALEAANQRLRDEAASRAAVEAQLRQMQKMEAVGQLTGGIAHDFNNMLAIVVGSLDIARRHLRSDNEKAERFISNALEGAQRGAQLTSRLAFSRQQPLDPRPIDTNQLVREMSELLQRTLGENIRLTAVLADGLWKTFADPLQLESAVINLCANSRDAMPDGGSLTLETSNVHLDEAYSRINVDARPGEYVAFAVSDTGSGMSAEVLTRAFDPFYTTKTTGKGTGLGLSQVYGFVKQSGGHVKIESAPARGTTVRFYLPRYSGTDQSMTAAPRDAQPSSGNREAILVVEDEDRVRHMTVEALSHLGYLVVSAAGPAEALDLLEGGTALHLLFTDVVMPAMNGRVLADRVRALRPGIKVLYTSAYVLNAGIHDGTLDRSVAFLAKPFTVDQLALKVRSTLDAPY